MALSRRRICAQTGKTIHPNQDVARAEAERQDENSSEGENFTHYLCQHCDGWHTGHSDWFGVLVNRMVNSWVKD